MSTDDLDRILAQEEALHPSSGFTAAVMARVREAASAPPPLPFPWLRFVLGALLLSAATGAGIWLVVSQPGSWRDATALIFLAKSLASPAMGAALGSLVATYLLVRLTLSWTGARG
jgi:hypothetical protein